jgi:hypothetical protein
LDRDKLHAHAFFRLAPLHDGAPPYLSCQYIKQQLDVGVEKSPYHQLSGLAAAG